MQDDNKLKLFGTNYLGYIVILVLSALSFMGLTYLLDGKFIYAISGAVLTAVLLLVYFVLPSTLLFKGGKSSVKTALRRVLIYTSPVIFCVLMVPVSHWLHLYEEKTEIETAFKESVASAKDTFKEYEQQTNRRITSYKKALNNTFLTPSEYNSAVSVMEKKLKPGFKGAAIKWMDNASKASFLNVLIYGNTGKFEDQINEWNTKLNALSKTSFDYEAGSVEFAMPHDKAKDAIKSLNKIRAIYFKVEMPGVIAIVLGLVFYIILLLPYILKSIYARKHHSSDDNGEMIFSGVGTDTSLVDEDEKNFPTFTLNM